MAIIELFLSKEKVIKMIYKTIINKIFHYSSALKLRSELILEIIIGEKLGYKYPTKMSNKIWSQPHIHEEFIWFTRYLKNDEEILLLDIGGNSGYWNETFRTYFPNAYSIGFEPVLEMFEKYEKRFENIPQMAKVYNVALGANKNEKDINVAEGFGLTSFLSYDNSLNEKNKYFTKTETVNIDTLDSYLTEISTHKKNGKKIIGKIDVQGYEVEVLKGAKSILGLIDILIIECSFMNEYQNAEPTFSKLASILNEYKLYPVRFGCFDYNKSLISYERNVLFIKDSYFEVNWVK